MKIFIPFSAIVLSQVVHARILTPLHTDYLQAISVVNRFCKITCPSKVLQPESTKELAAWMQNTQNTSIVVHGGGHSYSCQSSPENSNTVVVDTSKFLKDVDISRDGTFVRIGAGAVFKNILNILKRRSLTVLHGECLGVSAGGYYMNWGTHGLLSNGTNIPIKSVTGVTPRGSIINVDHLEGLRIIEKSPVEVATIPNLTVSDLYYFGTNIMVATEFEVFTKPLDCLTTVKSFTMPLKLASESPEMRKNIVSVLSNTDFLCILGTTTNNTIVFRCLDALCKSRPKGFNPLTMFMANGVRGVTLWKDDPYIKHAGIETPINPTHGWIPSVFMSIGNKTRELFDHFIQRASGIKSSSLSSSLFTYRERLKLSYLEFYDTDVISRRDSHIEANTESVGVFESLGLKFFTDPHVPACFKSKETGIEQVSTFYSMRLMLSKRSYAYVMGLVSSIDPDRRINYWLSVRSASNDGICPLLVPWGSVADSVSSSCKGFGITPGMLRAAAIKHAQLLL